MKEQNSSLNNLKVESEPKSRFNIKKILILAFIFCINYYIFGKITKRVSREPDIDCTWIKNKKPAITCSKECGKESLDCRQNCSKEDQECYKKCYDNIYLPCYETCYQSATSQIKMCETS